MQSHAKQAVGTAQAMLWVAVACHAGEETKQGTSFEELLCRYVDRGIAFTGALEGFEATLDALLQHYSEDPVIQYCLLATEASLALRSKKKTGRASRWASLFFDIELAAPALPR